MPAERATPPSDAVAAVLAAEEAAGLHTLEGHAGFAGAVARVRNDLVEFLVERSRRGETVVAYGAPGGERQKAIALEQVLRWASRDETVARISVAAPGIPAVIVAG
jgi:hypothetical protein